MTKTNKYFNQIRLSFTLVSFMSDIAMPNIEYEAQWQSQKLNKSFQQELERMKQEVYYEGLQVEEEGLTDIVRKKTKLHDTHFAEATDSKQDTSKSETGSVQDTAGPHKNDVQIEVF